MKGVKDLLLPLLREEQKKRGWISEKALKSISLKTGIPISRVYGVATFYAMLHTEKKGKNIIYVCNSISCQVNASDCILEILKKKLKIKPGETTKDKKFTLMVDSCIGCCDEAPAMLVNGKAYTKLNEKKIDAILKKCKS